MSVARSSLGNCYLYPNKYDGCIFKKGCRSVRMVKVDINSSSDDVRYNFGYNMCPLACPLCVTDTFLFCPLVASRFGFLRQYLKNVLFSF